MIQVENSHITTKTLIPYFDVSISSRDLVTRSKRQNKVLKFWLWYMNFLLKYLVTSETVFLEFSLLCFCICPGNQTIWSDNLVQYVGCYILPIGSLGLLQHIVNYHHQINSALHHSGDAKLCTSFGLGRGGKVTTAVWSHMACDFPQWRGFHE